MGVENQTPVTRQPVSLISRGAYHTIGLAMNRFMAWGISYTFWKDRKHWEQVSPSVIKSYPSRPSLQVRVFIPEKPREAKLPLFFLIHGGGFVIGEARMDDEQSHLLADKYGFVVVSPEYSLGPKHKFPTAIHDCAAILHEVLADNSLPIDTTKVVAGGFSAGAVITLALAQLSETKGLIQALVPVQALTDWTGEGRPQDLVTPWGKKDPLPSGIPIFSWAYIPVGHDLRDPLLSPLYASRTDIPQPVFFIGSSADCMHVEECKLAHRLASIESSEQKAPTESWEVNGVKYMCVEGMPHCFTHFWEAVKKPEWEKKRLEANEEVWKAIAEWTNRVLYSPAS